MKVEDHTPEGVTAVNEKGEENIHLQPAKTARSESLFTATEDGRVKLVKVLCAHKKGDNFRAIKDNMPLPQSLAFSLFSVG